jgi:tetratricopeptide (TPR) repeat protein
MNNLYLWFSDASTRRVFVLRMLQLEAIWAKGSTPDNLPLQIRDLAGHLQRLEAGRRHSPYFCLSSAREPLETTGYPWSPAAVARQGFRRIYTIRSHQSRPGHWLVLQFAPTEAGLVKRRWVLENFQNSGAVRATAPEEQQAAWWLEQADRLLERWREKDTTPEKLSRVRSLLQRVQERCPELFSGDRIYLWERLAEAFFRIGDLPQVEACLRAQASLQPNCSDAFLNLGYYLDRAGLRERAIAAYWEGLRIDPEDQYIIYNLAELHRDAGEQEQALTILDDAIERAEDPAILFKVKGDVLLQWGQFPVAALAYELALERLGQHLSGFKLEILLRLSTCYQRAGNVPRAVQALERGLVIDPDNLTILHEMTRLCCMLKRFREAVGHGEQLLSMDQGDSEVCFLLGVCYEQLGELGLAKWYRMRGEREVKRQEA